MQKFIIPTGAGLLIVLAVYIFWPSKSVYVETGPIETEGTVEAANISLVRRGTHTLTAESDHQYFLESAKHNLQEFVGRSVSVKGVVEANTSPKFDPVIVVESIEAHGSSGTWKEIKITSLSLFVSVPDNWEAAIEDGRASFSIPDRDKPIVIMESDDRRPDDFYEGLPLRISGRSGVRRDNDDGSSFLYVFGDDSVLVIRFTPPLDERLIELNRDFTQMLSTIAFIKSDASSSRSGGSGTGSSLFCGGAAGVLCLEGSYCDITDLDVNTGVCRKAGQ